MGDGPNRALVELFDDVVQVEWSDGRRQQTTVRYGLAASLLMPVEDRTARYGFRAVPFDRTVIELPDNWHGPFESAWWINGDTGRTWMVRFIERRTLH